ncbi:25301_t:CDS:2, partial [Racocetra persica]
MNFINTEYNIEQKKKVYITWHQPYSTNHKKQKGKQAVPRLRKIAPKPTIATKVSDQEFEEFTDEDEWIDELENDNEKTDQNLAIYLTESLPNYQKSAEILFDISTDLPTIQKQQIKNLLQE